VRERWPVLALIFGMLIVGILPWVFSIVPALQDLAFLFAPHCHQRPERTLELNGALMVVCSRCAGIYAGLALGALAAYFAQEFKYFRQLAWLGMALMLLDVITQDLGLRPPWHASRFTTGFFLAFVIATWVPGLLLKEIRARG